MSIFLGMGNPLLDISAEVPQSELDKWGAKLNNAILAEEKHAPMYKELVDNYDVEYIAGGATQNSMRVCAGLMGGKGNCAFFGCVGADAYGEQLKKAAAADGVDAIYMVDPNAQTGTCAVLIKDSERSLVANLSAANNFKKTHLETEAAKKAIQSAKFFYSSGFFLTVDVPSLMHVAEHAAAEGKTMMLNLAAPFLCQFFKDPMLGVMPYCDIVFGNESEAQAFAENNGLDDTSAAAVAKHISGMPKKNAGRERMCIITQGAEFTAVSIGGRDATKYPVTKLAKEKIVDTNGAGDAFVGGFCSKLLVGADVKECVEAGHDAAALIIQQSGCKLPRE
jgi:adenosine kinase